MCGIAGVIAWDDRYRVDRPTLQRMSARLAHRGPDGEGFYLNHEQEVTPDRPQCGFAFRRLAILDPEERAMQPFTIGDKTIVFNGEIYNFRELRAELTNLRPEYAWRTTGDTEVLLLAYDVWGSDCLRRVSGMFAIAVWDQGFRKIWFARDRMGQKPLFIARQERGEDVVGLAFASEIGPLLELGWPCKDLNPLALESYLRWGHAGASDTIYAGVSQLQAGTHTSSSGTWGTFAVYFYPSLPRPSPTAPPPPAGESPAARTKRLVRTAVSRQMVSDVPLGCFLSGGIDSSVVAAAMCAAVPAGQSVSSFTVRFDDPRYDEGDYAARVASHLGTRHHEFHVRPDAAADLPTLARAFGEPFGDSSALPTHYLARETRHHVKVALSGDGGDELFGGYDRYRAIVLAERLARLPLRGLATKHLVSKLPGTHPKSGPARLKRLLASVNLSPGERYSSYLSIFSPALLGELAPAFGEQVKAALRVLVRKAGEDPEGELPTFELGYENLARQIGSVRAALAVDRSDYLPGDLLTKVDRASMLHGLEVRSPFMDHELVQFAAGLTTDQLLKGGPKRMLREAFAADLPSWVFKRKKMGFAVPIGEWFRGELRPMLRDHLFAADSFGREHFDMKVVERLVDEHETQRVDHSQRLYALLMLELWWRTAR